MTLNVIEQVFNYPWVRIGSEVCTVCSIVANVLPKESALDGYPRIQKAYHAFIALVAGLAANLRVCLPSLAIPFLGFQHGDPHQPGALANLGIGQGASGAGTRGSACDSAPGPAAVPVPSPSPSSGAGSPTARPPVAPGSTVLDAYFGTPAKPRDPTPTDPPTKP